MIPPFLFPWLNGILSFPKVPVVWMLCFLNTFVLLFSNHHMILSDHRLESAFEDSFFIRTQGRVYAQYIKENPAHYSMMLQEIADKSIKGDQDKTEMLGSLAIRNQRFIQNGPNFDYQGDQVAFKLWKEKLAEVALDRNRHPNSLMGVSADSSGILRWISYQFMHGGVGHYAINMFLLLIFGSAIELILGGLGLLVVYLGTGMVAAGVFLIMTGASAAPLVGASGAVSGLIGCFAILMGNRPVKFFYWLIIPSHKHMGFIYLPAWICLLFSVIMDLAGYLGTISDFGGVAYTAHLGGQFAGVSVALSLLIIRKLQSKDILPQDHNFDQVIGETESLLDVEPRKSFKLGS